MKRIRKLFPALAAAVAFVGCSTATGPNSLEEPWDPVDEQVTQEEHWEPWNCEAGMPCN